MGPPLGMGVILLAVALALFGHSIVRVVGLRKGTPMLAKVTGHRSFIDGDQAMYSAIFEVSVGGRTVEGTSASANSWKSPEVGALVPVRFRPGDEVPLQDVRLIAYLTPAVFTAVGIGLAAAGMDVLRSGNPAWW